MENLLFDFKFSRLGENTITIQYGKGKTCYLNFYVIEPLENIIKKKGVIYCYPPTTS